MQRRMSLLRQLSASPNRSISFYKQSLLFFLEHDRVKVLHELSLLTDTSSPLYELYQAVLDNQPYQDIMEDIMQDVETLVLVEQIILTCLAESTLASDTEVKK